MYDYVIVGAGSAGCVLAARLSEDPGVSVCLIEAGPSDTNENIHVPAAFGRLMRTSLDWDYDTHEEPALGRRRIFLPRGRVLGGSSSTNTMVYVRGARADYDAWDQPGWSFEELLPYFLRSEDNERGASRYHGVGGPLAVCDGRAGNPMSAAFVESAEQAGHRYNADFNGATQDGMGFFQVTQRDGRRCSTAAGFLAPVADRSNLTVETHLQVHRVLFEHGRAVGVVGARLDETVTIRAAREVILSAGAYNTPQLLQLSGIGPAALLGAFGIPVVLDQPMVGHNLQDHLVVPLVYTHSQPVSMLAAGTPQDLEQFARHGRGPLTANGPECGGFARTRDGLAGPDVEFLTAPVMFADSGLGTPTAHAISIGPCMIAPRSRGQVRLALPDPTAKPQILHNYLADEADLDDAVEATRLGMRIARQKALAVFNEEQYRAPASESDEDVRDYVRRYAHSIFHAAGSCAMGSVVDAELRVLGVDGLRVVDASVMPTLIRGNPNAPVIAIAEKAADLVRGVPAPPAAGQSLIAATTGGSP